MKSKLLITPEVFSFLSILHRNCGIPDPSWSEIRHFVSFLNSQLRDCEQSIFCDMTLMGAVLAGPDVLNLQGFRSFVARFMIQMSRVRLVIILLLIPDMTHPCLLILAQYVRLVIFHCKTLLRVWECNEVITS